MASTTEISTLFPTPTLKRSIAKTLKTRATLTRLTKSTLTRKREATVGFNNTHRPMRVSLITVS